jgi:hypothetical protein
MLNERCTLPLRVFARRLSIGDESRKYPSCGDVELMIRNKFPREGAFADLLYR